MGLNIASPISVNLYSPFKFYGLSGIIHEKKKVVLIYVISGPKYLKVLL